MKQTGKTRKNLLRIYRLLYKRFGPQHWWPGETKLEIIVGAILTQNTSWLNVEKAIFNLKERRLLNINGLNRIPECDLARLIRPAGYYNIKAKRIKNFLFFLNTNYSGSLDKLFSVNTEALRKELLKVNGIGEETADSILLYAGEKPVFVVDTYTKRVFSRHGFIKENASYQEAQALFMSNLPKNVNLFNEYHALIVALGKNTCKTKKALCNQCNIEGVKNG